MRSPGDMARSADELERAIATIGLSEEQAMRVWDVWQERGHKRALNYMRTLARSKGSVAAQEGLQQARRA